MYYVYVCVCCILIKFNCPYCYRYFAYFMLKLCTKNYVLQGQWRVTMHLFMLLFSNRVHSAQGPKTSTNPLKRTKNTWPSDGGEQNSLLGMLQIMWKYLLICFNNESLIIWLILQWDRSENIVRSWQIIRNIIFLLNNDDYNDNKV